MEAVGVHLAGVAAVLVVDGILVRIIALESGDEALPDAALQALQGMGFRIPVVKGAKDTQLFGVWRPDPEQVAVHAVLPDGVRAEAAPRVAASPFTESLQFQKEIVGRQS